MIVDFEAMRTVNVLSHEAHQVVLTFLLPFLILLQICRALLRFALVELQFLVLVDPLLNQLLELMLVMLLEGVNARFVRALR